MYTNIFIPPNISVTPIGRIRYECMQQGRGTDLGETIAVYSIYIFLGSEILRS